MSVESVCLLWKNAYSVPPPIFNQTWAMTAVGPLSGSYFGGMFGNCLEGCLLGGLQGNSRAGQVVLAT